MTCNSDRLRGALVRAAWCALALTLSACGGGSGAAGGTSTPPPPPPAPPPVVVTDPAPAAATLRVHYFRPDASYANWGVYAWQGPKTPSSGWPGNRFLFDLADANGWGKHVDIPMDTSQSAMKFLISLPNSAGTDAAKDCPNDLSTPLGASLASSGQEVWVVSGDCTVYTSEPARFSLGAARAIWLSADTLLWPGAASTNSYQLLSAAKAGMAATAGAVNGADHSYALNVDSAGYAGLPAAVRAKYPQYSGATVLRLATPLTAAQLTSALRSQLVVTQSNAGKVVDGTQLQLAPVLDAVYAGSAPSAKLGLSFAGGVPSFSLWAPTAQSVTLNLFDSATSSTPSATLAMTPDATTGAWVYTAPNASWTNQKYYSYTVQVYSRAAGNQVVSNTVVDPYAVAVNALDPGAPAGLHAMVLNLADAPAKPAGWDTHVARNLPALLDGTDSAIYELHVREFSASDSSVGAAAAGRYDAFGPAYAGVSQGMRHLAALAQAGMTHVHLLPAVEFASIDEVRCSAPQIPAATGAEQSAASAVVATQNSDCYNWGYDPLLYGVPEGAYASNAADGSVRVREFRNMVMGLHSIGLRVVMDVVYNHTPASGQAGLSILDRIVPGYYYRLDASGNATGQSGAGPDLAAEQAMTAKLLVDTLTRWADQYKVDGFRFDIMSLMPKQVLLDIQSALNAVALADGRRSAGGPGVYLYGEGWTQNGLSFVNAQQSNMAGTGIGTFNDRMRDAVRGGSPFDSGAAMSQHQGFINGLCYDNNDGSGCDTSHATLQWCGSGTLTQQQCLYLLQSRISVGLAGNLASFPLKSGVSGAQLDYFGGPTGYTATPQENLAYISVHDNETVFDFGQYKHPATTPAAARARAQTVGLSLVALAQGVPFFQAGDDLLRSKSMDSNSYNSGDYFNRIDWSGSSNNWAVGAPPQNTGNNAANLATMTPLLNNPLLRVGASDISQATLAFQDLLRLRQDTSMFRLKTAAAIASCVSFPDQGAQQPGLIVMRISGAAGCGDRKYQSIVVLFNANKVAQTFSAASYAGRSVKLHALQAGGNDAVVKQASFAAGVFSVPARTTAVFVEP
ncbi:alpha-1,6-glucosidase domain-containing protein [Pseudoduganella danionis]|uniref:pullulanase n=1 Tax=Pseudoduganella danionis TaxID=1890295 RepID=A0ABW9SXK4_9BURK|nr:alpha-1,6-glucosidase domain-containing protein [Pseudoduganella danionis]MTW35394.1 DUF3372 domain-containing protein [Pseudoduganella danionis]